MLTINMFFQFLQITLGLQIISLNCEQMYIIFIVEINPIKNVI